MFRLFEKYYRVIYMQIYLNKKMAECCVKNHRKRNLLKEKLTKKMKNINIKIYFKYKWKI